MVRRNKIVLNKKYEILQCQIQYLIERAGISSILQILTTILVPYQIFQMVKDLGYLYLQ